jgi:hypothetical protein
MSWARIDDQLAFHRKVVSAGNASVGAWIRMLTWCAAHLSDGRVPESIARIIATQDEIDRSVRAGLLEQSGNDYVIHDYLQWNPSAEEVRQQRELDRERKRGRKSNGNPNGVQLESERPPDAPSHPIRIRSEEEEKLRFDLEAIYEAYPGRRGKAQGLKNLERKIKTQREYDLAMRGAKAFAEECRRKQTDKDYIPYFSTWTHQQRWEDYADSNGTAEKKRPAPKPLKEGIPIPLADEEPHATAK